MAAVKVRLQCQFDGVSVDVRACHRVHTGRGLCHRSQQQPQRGEQEGHGGS